MEIKFHGNMYFDVAFILFCLFRYFNFISKIKSALIFFLPKVALYNAKYAQRVTGFTQFHVLSIRFSHLTYISSDSSCSSLLLQFKSSLPMKSGKKKVSYGYCKGHLTTMSPLIKKKLKER